MKAKPVHEIRLGPIKATIWRNETEAGVRHNATFSRLHKNDDKREASQSFGRDDLHLLAKLADQTHTWVCAQGKQRQEPAIVPPAHSARLVQNTRRT